MKSAYFESLSDISQPNNMVKWVKKRYRFSLLLLMALILEPHAIATECLVVKYGQKLPDHFEEHYCTFQSGPNGERNPAYLEYEARKKAKEEYLQKTPIFKYGKITFLGSKSIPSLPNKSIWSYRISGLSPTAPNRIISLTFERTPPGLVFTPATKLDKLDPVEIVDQSKLKDITELATLPDSVRFSQNGTYFEKNIPANEESIDISILATSKPSDYVIGLKSTIVGLDYQPIQAKLPGPNIE
jgi:hypothetical protein